ncbi:MAG: serine/threonine-protein kinase [Polyangiaceae bacterium]
METTDRDWEHVGPYRIQSRIGAGGYAEVFAGMDTRSGQRVALKRLRLKHRGDADSRERFEREGLALEAIDHPNIVRCFGILVQEDEVWIVMELLKGLPLRQLLRDRGPLSVERALLIAIDVADGLADMHEMAIVHRDLKPENVFLTLPGYEVKIVDLGVAKFHGWSVPATDPGLLVCTPSYAAPEMSLGYAVDARIDIYALGLVMYEMLIGRNPFANGDGTLPHGQDALTAHIVRTPPAVRRRRPDVPEGVSKLIAQMMDKEPMERPAAMKVVARELRRALRALRKERPSRAGQERAQAQGLMQAQAQAQMQGQAQGRARAQTPQARASAGGGAMMAAATYTEVLSREVEAPLFLLPPVVSERAERVELSVPGSGATGATGSGRRGRMCGRFGASGAGERRGGALACGRGSDAGERCGNGAGDGAGARGGAGDGAAGAAVDGAAACEADGARDGGAGTMLIGGACGAVVSVRWWSCRGCRRRGRCTGSSLRGRSRGPWGRCCCTSGRCSSGRARGRPSAWIPAAGSRWGVLLGRRRRGCSWCRSARRGRRSERRRRGRHEREGRRTERRG